MKLPREALCRTHNQKAKAIMDKRETPNNVAATMIIIVFTEREPKVEFCVDDDAGLGEEVLDEMQAMGRGDPQRSKLLRKLSALMWLKVEGMEPVRRLKETLKTRRLLMDVWKEGGIWPES